jgi:hypothetical protein
LGISDRDEGAASAEPLCATALEETTKVIATAHEEARSAPRMFFLIVYSLQ